MPFIFFFNQSDYAINCYAINQSIFLSDCMWLGIIGRYAIKRIMQLYDMQLIKFECMSVWQKTASTKLYNMLQTLCWLLHVLNRIDIGHILSHVVLILTLVDKHGSRLNGS